MRDPSQAIFPEGRGPSNPYEIFPVGAVEQSIVARFEEQVRKHSGKMAVESAAGSLSYQQLDRAANQLATAIVKLRGTESEPVALLVSHGIPQITAILGALKAGKIYVPLDPAYPAARNAAVLSDLRPKLIVCDEHHQRMAAHIAAGAQVLSMSELALDIQEAAPDIAIEPDRPAVIIYTSGSTGKPNGLVHSHRNVLHATLKYTNNMHIGHEDRLLLLYSCAFIGSVADIFSALLNGATLLPYDLKRQGIGALAAWMKAKQVTLYQSVPTLFRRFAATLKPNEKFEATLRAIRLGGEPVMPHDVTLYGTHFHRDCLFAVSLASTEILGIRLYFVDPDDLPRGPRVPVGYALQDTEVLLVDDDGKPTSQGEIGEMVIRSPYLALGYWGDPKRTKAVFLADPDRPGTRLYHSRDLGLLHRDGCLEFLGRKDWQVKIRGHRIEIAEVESALLAVPGVKEAAVITQQAESGEPRLVAYIVPVPGVEQTVSGLRAALIEQLPEHMTPAAFVLLSALPTTPTGKIDRQSLPAPAASRPALGTAFVVPRNALEVAIVDIWRDCLNVTPIGVHDDFFELGGDSVLALDMALRVEETFARPIPQQALLASRTVEQLAHYLLRKDESSFERPLIEIRQGNGRPLFFLHGEFNGAGLFCIPLARHLNDIGLVAVHPHGSCGDFVPATIEEMAADRLRDIRTQQPSGPYRLAGHCNGALVAWAIAEQLLEQGETVELLAILAPPPSVQWETDVEAPAKVKPGGINLEGVTGRERSQRLHKAYGDACARFVGRRYGGSMLVMLPRMDATRLSMDHWQNVAQKTQFQLVPGGHLTVLLPRNLITVAAIIQEHLQASMKPPVGVDVVGSGQP
jgi:amino acid adenylation domain-containing protein